MKTQEKNPATSRLIIIFYYTFQLQHHCVFLWSQCFISVLIDVYIYGVLHFGRFDWRPQHIIITGSVVLLASIVPILVVRSNLSIKFYHPTTSLSWNLFVMQGNSWNCTTKYTKWTCCCTGEKWFLLQF